MKSVRVWAGLLFCVSMVLLFVLPQLVEGEVPVDGGGGSLLGGEAPAGFDNGTNGLVDQATHDADRVTFKAFEDEFDGLGPTFNGKSCAGCHSNPVAGGGSTVTELRAGHLNADGVFIPATAYVNFNTEPIPRRSLINQKGICPEAESTLRPVDDIRALRISLSLLGDGFVEAISDDTLNEIRSAQPVEMRGERVIIPSVDRAGNPALGFEIGRFGWKDQHVSLLSFSGDAYLNEMGITNRIPSNGSDFTHQCEPASASVDPEDAENDVQVFTRFIRATKAPARDEALAASTSAKRGSNVFAAVGCSICHTPTIVTASASTRMNSTEFVPPALANKTIHPYSDFLLHRIGTGDGIVQNGPPNTRNKVRTAPLWGLRTRSVFLHDGSAATLEDAIQRHAGPGSEAVSVVVSFNALGPGAKEDLMTFLRSL